MNTASLLKRAPIVIMVVCLSYACYTIHAILPGSSASGNDLANGLDVMVKDALHAGADEMKALTRDALRDPFRISLKSADAPKPIDVTAADPDKDPFIGLVQGLSLDATFLQGKTQIAIISGRMYHRGEHLVLQGETGKSFSPLFVQQVDVQRVTLMAHNRIYELGYPEKLGSRPADRQTPRGAPVDGSLAEIDPEGELAFVKRLDEFTAGQAGKEHHRDAGCRREIGEIGEVQKAALVVRSFGLRSFASPPTFRRTPTMLLCMQVRPVKGALNPPRRFELQARPIVSAKIRPTFPWKGARAHAREGFFPTQSCLLRAGAEGASGPPSCKALATS